MEATGYKTLAERPLNSADFPGAPAANLVPGSMVFHKTARPGRLAQLLQLVGLGAGTSWRYPLGPDRQSMALRNTLWFTLRMKMLKLTHTGQVKNCRLKRSGNLPLAAGLRKRNLPGAMSIFPDGKPMANSWQGEFPWQNLSLTVMRGLHRSELFRRTVMACMTWQATYGNGRVTGLFLAMPMKW